MPLLDVRTLEKALQYYSDHMHFDVLWLVILSDTQFAQRHKVAVFSYMQDASTQETYLFLALSPLS